MEQILIALATLVSLTTLVGLELIFYRRKSANQKKREVKLSSEKSIVFSKTPQTNSSGMPDLKFNLHLVATKGDLKISKDKLKVPDAEKLPLPKQEVNSNQIPFYEAEKTEYQNT